MGRAKKPVDLILMEQKTHLTKEQIQQRRTDEIKLKSVNIKADPHVLADKRALKEFKTLKKLYAEIQFVGTLDSHIINQYCLSVSELDDLVSVLSEVRLRMRDEDPDVRKAALGEFLELDTEVRLKRNEMIKLSDRLYLNPVTRTKNVPPKQEETPPQASDDLFGDTG